MYTRVVKVKKNNKSYEYLQLVNSYRKNGKPRQKVLLNLGPADEIDRDYVDEIVGALSDLTKKVHVLKSLEECHFLGAKNYGDIFVLQRLWEELNFDKIFSALLRERKIKFDVLAALQGMIFNRAIRAHSKLATYTWLKEKVYFPQAENLQVHHLYRAMDFLIDHKISIEKRIHNTLVNLMNYDTSVVFFDCSLVDMYGEKADLVQQSRKKRTQYLVSLVLSRDGLPLAHEVHPGNTADIATVEQTINRLKKRFSIGRCIFICDRGMVSQQKLEQLKALEYEYIVGVRLNQWKEVKEKVLKTEGEYTTVRDNLQVREVHVGDRRYIVCRNPSQARKDKLIREEVVEELEETLAGLDSDTREAARLYGHRYKGRFLKKERGGKLTLDYARIKEDEYYDGAYILLTSEKQLPSSEIALTYKRLSEIERSFRSLKSLHDMEPTYHSVDRRIRSHVALCVVAHLLERILEKKLEKEGIHMTASKALEHLGNLQISKMKLKNTDCLIRRDITTEVTEIFKALHYRPPSRVTILS